MIEWTVLIIDPLREFGRQTEDYLQRLLRKHALVKCYEQTREAVEALERFQHQVPLVVIADMAARTPSVEDGAFVQIQQMVPRCTCILYSTSVDLDKLRELFHKGPYQLVDRRQRESDKDLYEQVKAVIDKFEHSLEYASISQFAEVVRSTPKADESAIAGGSELTPLSMLIDIARGTKEGHAYLRDIYSPRLSQEVVSIYERELQELLQ